MTHAVVVGGSVAGLLAARALSSAFDRVTVLDRDLLPTGLEGRRAVPQGRHVHTLLPHGQACLETLLPGVCAEMAASGAAPCAMLEQLRFVARGHEFARGSLGFGCIVASRPFIEGHVRRRVRALANVELIERCDVSGLVADGARVAGVRAGARVVEGDLIVCATGRGGQVPAWLARLGFPAPREQRLAIDVGYASRTLRMPRDALGGDTMVIVQARPGHPRSLILFAQEDDEWLLTLGGYGSEHRPPREPDAFAAFAATVAPPDVVDAIRAAEPTGEIATHAFPAGRRRRYDRLRRLPAALLVCGDAVCSFNPLFGQGMSVAAAEAVALRGCLQRGDAGLARRFFAATRPVIDDAWRLATGADLALPEVRGRRPPHVRAINRYLRRLYAVAEHDAEVAAAFVAVAGMLERPAHVLRPGIVWRVLRSTGRQARPLPTSSSRSERIVRSA